MPQVDLRAEGYTVIGDHLVQFFYEGKAAFYPRRKALFHMANSFKRIERPFVEEGSGLFQAAVSVMPFANGVSPGVRSAL